MSKYPKLVQTILFLSLIPVFSRAQAPENLTSKTGERPVLLIFSGSDWCLPCIQLEKTVLQDSSFTAFAQNQLDIRKADFPQRKKLSREQQRINEALAERFNPEGTFPKIILLKPDETPIATLPWKNQTPAAFSEQIRSLLNQQK